MAKIRHLAFATQDPAKASAFYKQVFGFKELKHIDNERAEGYFLSDGCLNIAVLKFKSDQLGKGMDYVGLHHFGVYTDEADYSADMVEKLGGHPYVDEMEVPEFVDGKWRRPEKFVGYEGMIFDISEDPWPGTAEYEAQQAAKK
jgi:catechol 2,3-dioxygenase-like lactoylglutathione lyase family enzyme